VTGFYHRARILLCTRISCEGTYSVISASAKK
jgi:hypothetical protein